MAGSEILSQLYQISPKGISLGVQRLHEACDRLGNPQNDLVAIQVAGTNGKGSVCGILELALRKTGKKTGLFTSPHIHRFTERIQINGNEVSLPVLSNTLIHVLNLTKGKDALPLTFFEVATLSALLLFQQEKIDVAILEVGLGGRLDATSVVTPVLGIITSIGLDHMDYLGHTLAEIAAEKAGIGKAGMTVLCGDVCLEARKSIDKVLAARQSNVIHLDSLPLPVGLQSLDSLFFSQRHQQQNAALALHAFLMVHGEPPDSVLAQQFVSAVESFGLPGRFEFIKSNDEQRRAFLLDGAHNEEAMTSLITAIRDNDISISQIVFGALQGKPADRMITELRALTPNIVIVPAPIARSFDAPSFADKWSLPLSTIEEEMITTSPKGGLTLVTGSFFVAAEARRLLLSETADAPVAL